MDAHSLAELSPLLEAGRRAKEPNDKPLHEPDSGLTHAIQAGER